jgi:hypothetical protein
MKLLPVLVSLLFLSASAAPEARAPKDNVDSGTFLLVLQYGAPATNPIPTATSLPLIFNYVPENSNFGNVTAPVSSFVVPVDGYYRIDFFGAFLVPDGDYIGCGDQRSIIVYVNNNILSQTTVAAVHADQTRISATTGVIHLFAGDEVAFNVYQASGQYVYFESGQASINLEGW